jgi:starch synthase (maltosyl-transferring)
VDRERARFSSWYEVFPRSTSPEPGRPGTFRDLEVRLAHIAGMGFDVVYLPPIHPIGRTHRKGRNNDPAGGPEDVGSPWAIGSEEGGHQAIHPALGTAGDFRAVVARARELGMEIALDLAFQCSPDHPYVTEHPEWFRARPDGTIQYAENPPKKYEDIYPFDFETPAWRELWEELASVVFHWIGEGVRIFRVDNPHTKPFRFWKWLIARVRREHPDVIFLSEAFTRPKVMVQLAKVGFTQSYTYFTWREGREEFEEYLTELTRTGVADFFRPNFWTNTPDILPGHLQEGGRPMYLARLVLAATLTASYGMYGPAFELMESTPREKGSEEYLDSEKYEVRCWDLDREGNLREEITAINRIRRENPALQWNDTLAFHRSDNGKLLVYSKTRGENRILVVVNLETAYPHSGWLDLDLKALGLEKIDAFEVHDLLTGERFVWRGARNFVELDPKVRSAHVFRVGKVLPAEEAVEPATGGTSP